MTGVVMDSSALLAVLLNETGADAVASLLADAEISTVNLSEVIARMLREGMPLETIDYELGRMELEVIPFDASLARVAATFQEPTRSVGLSFGDRACLALGLERGRPVLTGDRDWTKAKLPVKVRLFR